ncbi:hypothetical protein [Hymenobacter metallicola]|uniref:Uncharacterized protein n=1 Tax=Hymenobacter metallicola TaxID=2563114 RepID=A0A4Z0QE30_9BACT|nr:hypothetical protein [Hymenobacter metallicola]TGE26942.1 hypothetical protein E5K02_11075 [Hymenobacter metallicola]
MKNVLHLLIGFTCTVFSGNQAQAATCAVPDTDEQTSPAPSAECWARSLKLTCYYTDALRLNSIQAAAVKQATLQELQQLEQLSQAVLAPSDLSKSLAFTESQVVAQYDAAMLRILTPGQYNTFHLLQERQAGLKLQPTDHIARK